MTVFHTFHAVRLHRVSVHSTGFVAVSLYILCFWIKIKNNAFLIVLSFIYMFEHQYHSELLSAVQLRACEPAVGLMRSHFSTCPLSNDSLVKDFLISELV